MQVSLTLGERIFVHVLFGTFLNTPTIEDAMQMMELRKRLELAQLPEGQLSRAQLDGSLKEAVVEQAHVRWLREKIRAAFAAQKVTSTYSDFALSLLALLDPL
jgi:hypothetical protein